MSSLYRLKFGTYLIYSPRGQSNISQQSKDITYGIKNDTNNTIMKAVESLGKNLENAGFKDYLGKDLTLVPVPKRHPRVDGALWPAERICYALLKVGIGTSIERCIEREKPVRRSATSNIGERPTVAEHLDTLICKIPSVTSRRFLLVDDVLTKGATVVASAQALLKVVPSVEVSAFCLVRTMGLIPDVEKIVDPCIGEIVFDGTATARTP